MPAIGTEASTFCHRNAFELSRCSFWAGSIAKVSSFEYLLFLCAFRLAQLHDTVKKKFGGINDAQLSDDLREWSKLYGVEARLVRPSFEEYSPEFRSIAANGATMRRLNEEDCSSVVVLTKQTITSNELPSTPSVVPSLSRNGVSRQPHHNASLLNTSPPNSRTESVFSGVAKPRGPTSKIYNYTPPLSQQMAINGLSNIKKVANVRKESEVIAYSHQVSISCLTSVPYLQTFFRRFNQSPYPEKAIQIRAPVISEDKVTMAHRFVVGEKFYTITLQSRGMRLR